MPCTSDHAKSQPRRENVLRACFSPRADGDRLHVSFAQCFKAHLGLRLRADEAQRCIRRIFAACSCSWNPKLLELNCENWSLIEGKLSELAAALTIIACRPLTPRLVAAALGISGQERARWTKDGRLPHSGQVVVRRGSPLSIPTYSVEAIQNLAAHPEIVIAWRKRDIGVRARA